MRKNLIEFLGFILDEIITGKITQRFSKIKLQKTLSQIFSQRLFKQNYLD